MPRMGSFGGASWYAFKQKKVTSSVLYGSLATSTAGPHVIPWDANTRVGDIGLVMLYSNTSAPTYSTLGWTPVSATGSGMQMAYKKLTLADLTATVTRVGSGDDVIIAISVRGLFAGLSVLHDVGETNDGVTNNTNNRTWTGFTKGVGCLGLIFVTSVRTGDPPVFNAPSLPNRQLVAGGSFIGGTPVMTTRVDIDFVPAEYVDTTAITYTGYNATYGSRGLIVFKLA